MLQRLAKNHIVLIGFMGSGKSTIGTLLADKLNQPFIDTDELVVNYEKMPISQIFEEKGERYFREVESKILQSALKSKVPSIISTGGGAPCHLDGMKYIEENGFSFYLRIGRKTLFGRIYKDKSRPLAKFKTKHALKEFIDISLRKREIFYKKADKTIMANNVPKYVASRILKYIDKENK